MRLFHKIFLSFIVIFGITFQIAGSLIINFHMKMPLNRKKNLLFRNFNIISIFCNRFSIQNRDCLQKPVQGFPAL